MVQKRADDERPYRLYLIISAPGGMSTRGIADYASVIEAMADAYGHGRGSYLICDEVGEVVELNVVNPSPKTTTVALPSFGGRLGGYAA